MNTSEQIDQIASALAMAQGEFPKIAKNKHASVNGVSKASGKEYSIGYNYADIADVISAIAPVLSKHGIAFIQPTVMMDSGMFVCTRLIHKSGQWIESLYPVCGVSGDHQKMGGALTYARRYSLCSSVGVAADEDVDGEGAEQPAPPPRRGPISEKRAATIENDNPFNDPEHTPVDHEYLAAARDIINDWSASVDGLRAWWKTETPHRVNAGIVAGKPEFVELFDLCKSKGEELNRKAA